MNLNKKFNFSTIKFLKILNKQNNALDLACGNGEYSIILAKGGWKVLSVDKKEIKETKVRNLLRIDYYKIDLQGTTYNPILSKRSYVNSLDTNYLLRAKNES